MIIQLNLTSKKTRYSSTSKHRLCTVDFNLTLGGINFIQLHKTIREMNVASIVKIE